MELIFLFMLKTRSDLQSFSKLGSKVIRELRLATSGWEDQAFSPSYDLAPLQPPPLPLENCPSFLVSLFVAVRAFGRGRVGEGAGEEPNHTMPRRPGPL
jgi:hypothetical protein